MRQLTLRQTAVLAAVERLGHPTVPQLKRQFPHFNPSEILRVLRSLERRGLVRSEGDPRWVYLGDEWVPGAPRISPQDVCRFWSTFVERAVGEAG